MQLEALRPIALPKLKLGTANISPQKICFGPIGICS